MTTTQFKPISIIRFIHQFALRGQYKDALETMMRMNVDTFSDIDKDIYFSILQAHLLTDFQHPDSIVAVHFIQAMLQQNVQPRNNYEKQLLNVLIEITEAL